MDQKAQFEAALAEFRAGNPQVAAELCERSLETFPGDANFLCLSARANLVLKHFDEAKKQAEQAITLFPDFALAHETIGDVFLVGGEGARAQAAYETAMRLDPARPGIDAKIERAETLERSIDQRRKRIAMRRVYDAEIRKAQELERNGEAEAAEKIYRDVLTKDPEHVEAARLLAGIAMLHKRYRDAEIFLKKAVEIAPDYARAWVDLVTAQRELHRFDDALLSARQLLRITPEASEAYVVLAGVEAAAGNHDEAIQAYRKALDIKPDRIGAMTGLAHNLKTVGATAEAVATYRRVIEARPDHAEAFWSLANLKTFRFDDAEVEAMETLLRDGGLPDESRAQLHNALGLEFEGRKDYDRAFGHFARCNEARRPLETYDPVDTESTCSRLVEMFTPAFIEQNRGVEDQAVTPILIVGLPRSGSTLIEQILASHSMVDGTHELGDLSRAVQSVRRMSKRRARFPEALAGSTIDEWREIGRKYLETTEVFRAGAPYFIDKNPNNFVYTGILKLALPNAKVIDARRHPLDSCLGSFKQLFASGQPFTYDVTELGEYYLQYQRLMDHWHAVLPGFVLDVQYENVVADLETEVRRILDFCGLPFEEACLRFHETERAVKTASSEQVRRPIYASSVNLWRNYEDHLGELVHILEPLLSGLPDTDRPAALQGTPVTSS